MKLKEADFKDLYTQWKKVFLSYIDLYQVFNSIEYIDDDELIKYIGELEELLYAIIDCIRILGGEELYDEY